MKKNPKFVFSDIYIYIYIISTFNFLVCGHFSWSMFGLYLVRPPKVMKYGPWKCDHGKCLLKWDNFIVKKPLPNHMLRPASNPSSDVEGKIIPFNPNASQHNAFKDELNPRVLANIGPNLLAKFAMTMEGL